MRRSSSGFSVVEGLLLFVVLGVFMTASSYVYKRIQSADGIYKSSANAGAILKTPTKKNISTKVIKIPEFGIEFTAPTTLRNLTYRVIMVDYSEQGSTLLGTSPTAYLSTKELDKAEQGVCDIGSASINSIAPLGYLARVTGQYSSDVTPPPGAVVRYPSNNTANPTGLLMKQFPEFYIAYRPATTGCFNQAGNNETAASLSGQLSASLKTATLSN